MARVTTYCDTTEVLEAIQLARKITGLGYEEIIRLSGYESISLTRDLAPLRVRNAVYGVLYLENIKLRTAENKAVVNTEIKKATILYNNGFSVREAAVKLNVSKSTANRLYARVQDGL